MTSVPEDGVGHAEHAGIELDGRVEIGDGEDKMVEAIDAHDL